MSLLMHMIPAFSAAAASALFSAIWEGTVLAVFVVVCLRLLPGLSAAARSAIWLSVFLLLVLLHVVPAFPSHWAAAGMGGGVSTVELDLRWSLGVCGLWAMLSLWRGGQLVVSAVRLHRMAVRATAVEADAALRALLLQPGEGGRKGRATELCTSAEVERPSVFGFFRPRILIPPGLLEELSSEELQQVVLHEMEHLRRADDWTNLLQKLVLVLFPLNPVLLWVEHRLCAERELACDDRVLDSSAGRKAYALCLTHLAEYSILHRSLSLVLGAWERRPELVRRVQRILQRPAQSMSRRPAMFVSASLVLGALGCAVALSRSPQLVGFASNAQDAAMAPLAPGTETARADYRAMGGTPELVKAVMPQAPRTVPSSSMHRRAAAQKRAIRRQPAQVQRKWVVLTEWRADEAPPHLIFAVAPMVPSSDPGAQSSFAAVRIANGWLIVQI
jgi:beta-lactamase regulating signal transducer with metallopeptidase domain